jgi:IclR family KDG regulon transcriptional repressor
MFKGIILKPEAPMEKSTSDKYNASTIQRSLDVLNLFKEHERLSFTEILDALKYNKSTLFRVLHTLEQNKYLARDKHGRYELGMSVFILGNQVSQANKLKKVAYPYLKELSQRNNQTIHLNILDGLDVVVLDKFDPPNNIKMMSRIGGVVPAHCTGQGKTLLAYSDRSLVEMIINKHGMTRYTPNTIMTLDGLFQELQQIRERGYSVDRAEHEKHICCVSVPILNSDNRIEAAISMTGLTMEYPDDQTIAQKAQIIKNVRDKIAKEMGYL